MVPRSRLLLVEEHSLVAGGLSGLLTAVFDVIGVADSTASAMAAVAALAPDAVLLRLSLPGGQIGMDLFRWLTDRRPAVRIAVITGDATGVVGDVALQRRAAVIMKPKPSSAELLAAITAVLSEHQYGSTRMVRGWRSPSPLESGTVEMLTPRELAVLQQLARGLTNEAIGATMGISARGVHFHRTNIRRKLNLHSNAALLRFSLLALHPGDA